MEFREPKGIYQQIADQISVRILQGDWKVGERIPSIRELAVELGVNPNTVTKSYQSLLEKQIINNQRGKGYFVTEDATSRVRADMKEEFLQDELPRIARAMELLDIQMDELAAHLSKTDEGDKK